MNERWYASCVSVTAAMFQSSYALSKHTSFKKKSHAEQGFLFKC